MWWIALLPCAVGAWITFLEWPAITSYVISRPHGRHAPGPGRVPFDQWRLTDWADTLHGLNVNGDYARLARA